MERSVPLYDPVIQGSPATYFVASIAVEAGDEEGCWPIDGFDCCICREPAKMGPATPLGTKQDVCMVKAPICKLPKASLVRPAHPAVNVRPNGRIRWQQERKEETRSRLLKAAAKAFARRSYAVTSVEDIVTLADVGRTSFYRHFDSKWSIASALCEEVMPAAWRLWKELAAMRDPSQADIAAWLERRIRLYSEHRAMFAVLREAVAIEPAGLAAVARTHDEVINVLATGIPAFNLAVSESPVAREVWIKACLLLMQLDEFNYVLAVRKWDVDHDLAVRVMASQFRQFIDDVATMSAGCGVTADRRFVKKRHRHFAR